MVDPLGLGEQPDWVSEALCAEVGGDLWFAEKGNWHATVKAKRICRQCPVRPQCLLYALERGEQYGVWGGMTPEQRSALRRPVAG